MKNISRMTVCTLAILFLASAVRADPPATTPMVATLRVPNEGIAPQAAIDERGRLHLIYFKGDPKKGDIFYVRSDDGTKTFTAPMRVNSQPGSAIAIGTVRVPQVALGKNGRVHVAWMGSEIAEPKVAGTAAPMLYARLNDAGDAFEKQKNVIAQHPGLDGGGSVAADGEGNVYVAWHAPKSEKTEADRWVWVARSQDEGKSFAAEMAANKEPTGACGCCGMKISASTDGGVFIAYRTATQMVNRDMHLLVSTDKGATFATVAVDPWKVGACVMSTSAFAESSSESVGAWETEGVVRFVVIRKDRQTTAPASVSNSSDGQKYPSVAVNGKGQFLVAWAEGTGWSKGGAVAWQVYDPDGAPIAGQAGRAAGLPAWSMPAAFAKRDGTFGIAF